MSSPPNKPKVVVVISQKGGAGKTILTLCMAVAAQRQGLSVVVLDLDPQLSASDWGQEREADEPVVFPILTENLPQAIAFAKKGGADLVLIDTVGRATGEVRQVASAADLLLVPCRAANVDLQSLRRFRERVLNFLEVPFLVVLNAVESRGRMREEAEELLTELNFPVCSNSLGRRFAFDQAYGLGLTPQELPRSDSGARKASTEISALYEEVSSHLSHQRMP